MSVSDFQINSRTRSVFARHWIDVQKIRISSFRGTVRVSGDLVQLGDSSVHVIDEKRLQTLECEVRRIPAVRQVFFDFASWRRSPTGEWENTKRASAVNACDEAQQTLEIEERENQEEKKEAQR